MPSAMRAIHTLRRWALASNPRDTDLENDGAYELVWSRVGNAGNANLTYVARASGRSLTFLSVASFTAGAFYRLDTTGTIAA